MGVRFVFGHAWIVAVVIIGGCRQSRPAPVPAPKDAEPRTKMNTSSAATEKEIDSEKLRAAPEVLEQNGVRLVLQPYLWRNNMPVVGSSDPAMLGALTLKTVNGEPLPAGLRLGRVWLLHDRQTWTGQFTDEEYPDQVGAIEKMFRDGPPWPAGIRVHVIVQVLAPDGSVHLLRASGVEVHQVS